MTIRLLLLFATLVLATGAAALDVEGVKLDDKTSVGGQELVLNGAGIRKRAIFKVYVGSLYVPENVQHGRGGAREGAAAHPARTCCATSRRISWSTRCSDGLKRNLTAAELQAIAVQTGELATIMKSFGEAKEGSVVTLDYVDNATKIGLNGATRGTIAGEAFNNALMRIWLGDKPVQDDLKKAMLGGALITGAAPATGFSRRSGRKPPPDRRFPAQLPRAARARAGSAIVRCGTAAAATR